MESWKIHHVDGRTETRFGEPSLEELQEAVGGYIEVVHTRRSGNKLLIRYVNEEGRLLNLPVNARFPSHCGNVVDAFEYLDQD